ncbi:MAG: Altered inheritance of mitochondria protein 6 [Ramalina farinacea]|uniref:Altered inheritance of mitochondria protein 6 n=1 Tax=Ramalina farinacea TaxID=258253 RepID=A0AA43TTT0_9LECA|nr:Altered inheritance of mitochondria protein 6 [Ramalina farinacea]
MLPSPTSLSARDAYIAHSLLISLLIYYTIHLRSLIPRNDIERIIASWGQPGSASQNAKPPYPSNLTLGIEPIPCHSHNDYTRHVPLYDALAAGCTGVEADVWLQPNGDLFVGHTKNSLSQTRTLQSLYVDPLVAILSLENAFKNTTTPATSNTTSHLQGIFDAAPQTSLTLLIDVKTSGASTFPVVHSALETLRSKDFLTYYNGSHLVPGPITVVATGNTPFSSIFALPDDHRDVFFDAPLDQLSGEEASANGTLYNSTNSYYASVSFPKAIGKPNGGMFSPAQVDLMRRQIKGAQDRGLKARYWDTPAWPVGLRDHVWNVLVSEGVGMLNVDDLKAASQQNWGS